MDKAFPGALQPLPVQVPGKRIKLTRSNDEEEYTFKLCSKLFDASDPSQQEIFDGVHEFHGVKGLPFLAKALG
jgi:hypothetical protein